MTEITTTGRSSAAQTTTSDFRVNHTQLQAN